MPKKQAKVSSKAKMVFGKALGELHCTDCLDMLKRLQVEHGEFIDLIYIDPPFNSGRSRYISAKGNKIGYEDVWSKIPYKDTLNELRSLDEDLYSLVNVLAKSRNDRPYLYFMAIRILYMHKVLKKTGSFYLHSDPSMCHYLKVICDHIFRNSNFRNLIIWNRAIVAKSSKSRSNSWPKNHDILLYYVKSKKSIYNKLYLPYSEEYLKRMFREKDEKGNLFRWQVFATYSTSRFEKLKKENKLRKLPGAKNYEYKQFLQDSRGIRIPDVWNDIKNIKITDESFTGYPTQKPEELLKRIILSATNEGNTVADFFCGSGTALKVANKLKRKWIGVDSSKDAIKIATKNINGPSQSSVAK
jgi:DNA modification methylase